LSGDADRMSGYLANLLSRSVAKPAVQPRLSALLGPAIAGPEWVLPKENEPEEVRVDQGNTATPDVVVPMPTPISAAKPRHASLIPPSPPQTDFSSSTSVALAGGAPSGQPPPVPFAAELPPRPRPTSKDPVFERRLQPDSDIQTNAPSHSVREPEV